MKKIYYILPIVTLVIFAFYILFNQTQSGNSTNDTRYSPPMNSATSSASTTNNNSISLSTSSSTSSLNMPGKYLKYTGELTKDVKNVLFFRASWCPTCKALNTNISNNLDNITSGVVIHDVDYDNSDSLKQKYGVTYQHTLVQVDENGNLIKKWSGSPTLTSLLSEIK